MFGDTYSYGIPNTLSEKLKEYVTHDGKNEVKYNQLYSVYSYPNIVLPLIGGVLIDKLGLNIGIIVFCFFNMLGQSIFSISGWIGTTDRHNNWPFIVAITGRFIFGVGGDSLMVCQSVSVSRWFRGSELSFALALTTSVYCIASACNDFSMPLMAEKLSLGFAMTAGSVMCVMSFMFAFMLA